jgi:hypothetical protein
MPTCWAGGEVDFTVIRRFTGGAGGLSNEAMQTTRDVDSRFTA